MKKLMPFILIILLFPIFVHAESGYIVGYDEKFAKDVYNAPFARFYDFIYGSSTNNTNAVTTQYSDGFGYVPNPITAILVDDKGPGSAIAFDVNESFIDGFVYNIHVYLCSSPTGVYPILNTVHTGISTGATLGVANNNYVNGSTATILNQTYSYGQSRVYSNGNQYCGRLSFVFIPRNTGTTIFVPFMASGTSSNWTFFGYSLTNFGQYNSLSSSAIQQIITNNNSVITSNITSAQNSINNNISNSTNQINNNITNSTNQIDSTIKDDSVDDSSSTINGVKDNIATNGVITQLVTLPITLFQRILSSVNGQCTSYNLGSLYGKNLVLPCINIASYIGSALWGVIDVLISGILVYSISKKMVKVFNHLSSMKEGDILDD